MNVLISVRLRSLIKTEFLKIKSLCSGTQTVPFVNTWHCEASEQEITDHPLIEEDVKALVPPLNVSPPSCRGCR